MINWDKTISLADHNWRKTQSVTSKTSTVPTPKQRNLSLPLPLSWVSTSAAGKKRPGPRPFRRSASNGRMDEEFWQLAPCVRNSIDLKSETCDCWKQVTWNLLSKGFQIWSCQLSTFANNIEIDSDDMMRKSRKWKIHSRNNNSPSWTAYTLCRPPWCDCSCSCGNSTHLRRAFRICSIFPQLKFHHSCPQQCCLDDQKQTNVLANAEHPRSSHNTGHHHATCTHFQTLPSWA